jgi:hypothetical protein
MRAWKGQNRLTENRIPGFVFHHIHTDVDQRYMKSSQIALKLIPREIPINARKDHITASKSIVIILPSTRMWDYTAFGMNSAHEARGYAYLLPPVFDGRRANANQPVSMMFLREIRIE